MTHARKFSRRSALTALLGGLAWGFAPRAKAADPSDPSLAYRYRSANFGGFVADSYVLAPEPKPRPFRDWLEDAYREQHPETLNQALARHRAQLQTFTDLREKAALERATAAWLHKTVKTLIPKFSLERGYEFASAVRHGERQCLLQSVLIAGLLQEAGLDAGVVMVWQNQEGKISNLGHAVALLRLSEGKDLLVDASDPTPFMRHRGLYLWDLAARDYRFVEACYAPDDTILGYARKGDGGRLAPRQTRPLDVAFLHSQFDFYRGERAPGGLLGPSTPTGLAASARFLERAARQQPRNPLAVYALGHVYRKQNRLEAARAQYRRGHRLYLRQGFLPDGPREALAWAGTP